MQVELDEEDNPEWPNILQEVGRLASQEARKKAFEKGLSVVYAEGGKLLREHADGTIEVLGDTTA